MKVLRIFTVLLLLIYCSILFLYASCVLLDRTVFTEAYGIHRGRKWSGGTKESYAASVYLLPRFFWVSFVRALGKRMCREACGLPKEEVTRRKLRGFSHIFIAFFFLSLFLLFLAVWNSESTKSIVAREERNWREGMETCLVTFSIYLLTQFLCLLSLAAWNKDSAKVWSLVRKETGFKVNKETVHVTFFLA